MMRLAGSVSRASQGRQLPFSRIDHRAQPRRVSRAVCLEADRTLVPGTGPQRDEEELVTRDRQDALEPLDGCDPRAVQRLAKEEGGRQRRIAAIQVDVLERQSAAAILRRDDEGRAVDRLGIDPDAGREASHQARLPRAEIADQPEQLTTARGATEPRTERFGVLGTRAP